MFVCVSGGYGCTPAVQVTQSRLIDSVESRDVGRSFSSADSLRPVCSDDTRRQHRSQNLISTFIHISYCTVAARCLAIILVLYGSAF